MKDSPQVGIGTQPGRWQRSPPWPINKVNQNGTEKIKAENYFSDLVKSIIAIASHSSRYISIFDRKSAYPELGANLLFNL